MGHPGDEMRHAGAYLRRNQIFVFSMASTIEGVWITRELCGTGLGLNVAPKVLGDAVLNALSLSTMGVPHPTDWSAISRPLLQAAGVKNWSTFSRGAKHVTVSMLDSGIRFMPTENGGSKEGFLDLADRAIVLEVSADSAALGSTLLQCFDASV